MKMQLDPTVIYRVPQFSHQTLLSENWEELKRSISYSSADFYNQIREITADNISGLPRNIQHTIWKYYNRACYRGTPYGSFAGIGVCTIGSQGDKGVTISNNKVLHRFNDWTEAGKISFPFKELVKKNIKLFANSSYYQIGGTLRYIDRNENAYEIAEMNADELTVTLLKACRFPTAVSDLMSNKPAHIPEDEYLSVLESMVSDQLLISELEPNLIGADYFERIGQQKLKNSTKYIIAERRLISGSIEPLPFKHIPALVEHLHLLLPSYKSPELEQFVSRFNKKFSEREIPIMVALDPEIGVGYGDMESSVTGDPLIERLLEARKKEYAADDNQITLPLLLSKLLGKNTEAIDLETLTPITELTNEPLPNSLPVLCTYSDGKVHIDHLGGCSSNMLLGRFSHAGSQIYEHCKAIAEAEQIANPEVLFFDIAYAVGTMTDNVNRHKAIYSVQLSILNYDTSKSPLTLDDILLSVRAGQLILRSKSLGMRLIPRMASAYNYQLSDLPVFRLLCDLQYQGIHKNLYLRLRDRLPDLSYYPQIYYKNIIVSPQTWRIDLKDISPNPKEIDTPVLLCYLKKRGVSDFVKTGRADQTLCIDLTNEFDLAALVQLLFKQKTLYLEESTKTTTGLINDQNGHYYQSQLLFNLRHNQNIYKGISPIATSPLRMNIPPIISPGGNWLYFEIYCHPHRADHLLIQILEPFLLKQKEKIKQWFFIRYSENGHHLRLRLLLQQPEYMYIITENLGELLNDDLQTGLISEFLIKTYRRETERYGMENIDLVESQFCKNCVYIMELLKRELQTVEKYKRCLDLINMIDDSEVMGVGGMNLLVEQYSEAFTQEHNFGPDQFKLMNVAYLDFKKLPPFAEDKIIDRLLFDMVDHWIMVLSVYPGAQRATIVTALLHMHVNRLFQSDQRVHEAVIYYLTEKEFKRSRHARSNSVTLNNQAYALKH